eukprot:2869389-Pyramimonas_sp.AAC.1
MAEGAARPSAAAQPHSCASSISAACGTASAAAPTPAAAADLSFSISASTSASDGAPGAWATLAGRRGRACCRPEGLACLAACASLLGRHPLQHPLLELLG